MMMKAKLITPSQVVNINKAVCEEGGNEHRCYGIGKVESALHSSFYPGDPPFSMAESRKLRERWLTTSRRLMRFLTATSERLFFQLHCY